MHNDDTPPSILDKNWRSIPDFEGYLCNREGEVYSLKTRQYIHPAQSNWRSSPGSYAYTLYAGKHKRRHISVKNLVKLVWPDWFGPLDLMIDGVEYRQLPEYQDYYISEDGILINHAYNDRRIATVWHGDKETARISVNQIQITISINELLKELWTDEGNTAATGA